jgi:ubiquinone/menaquinone biosynthesis C-methylase UbiE
MKDSFSWQYDEFEQVGTDYGSKSEVEIYDSSHSEFRDMEVESLHVLYALEIKSGNVLIDFGSGTGTFAIQAAKRCDKVYAVDVSQAMIERAKAKAIQAKASNIEFHHAGFLTYEHNDHPVDAIDTTFTFHHLPDFWKGIALKRLNRMLKPGGQLYIHDVVIEEANAIENIAAFIDKLATAGGKLLREDTERHIKEEYSTYDWVMDGLLTRSGFIIKNKHIDGGVLGTYICTKK